MVVVRLLGPRPRYQREGNDVRRVRLGQTHLQPPYHLFRREIEHAILPYAGVHDIGVLVYGPMAHGLLSGQLSQSTAFAADDWRSRSPDFTGDTYRRNLAVVQRLTVLARASGITLPQLAVAWTLANPAVHVAIVGAR